MGNALSFVWARAPGKESLLTACRAGDTPSVRTLLRAGAPVDTLDIETGESALQLAVRSQSSLVVGLLLDAGATVNWRDNAGHTALMEAVCVKGRSLAITAMLMETGTYLFLRNNAGNTAMQLASRVRHFAAVDFLTYYTTQSAARHSEGGMAVEQLRESLVRSYACSVKLPTWVGHLGPRPAHLASRNSHPVDVLMWAAAVQIQCSWRRQMAYRRYRALWLEKTFTGPALLAQRLWRGRCARQQYSKVAPLAQQRRLLLNSVHFLLTQAAKDNMAETGLHDLVRALVAMEAEVAALASLTLMGTPVARLTLSPLPQVLSQTYLRRPAWVAALCTQIPGAAASGLDADGQTVLHRMIAAQDMAGVSQLAPLALLFTQRAGDSHTPLTLAVQLDTAGNIFPALIKGNCSFHLTGPEGRTPLHVACHNGHLLAARWLLAHPDVDITLMDAHGCSALHTAVLAGHLDVCRALLLHPQHAILLEQRTSKGLTALMLAVKTNHEALVALLLRCGADPSAQTQSTGDSVLSLAITHRAFMPIVDLLLEHDLKGFMLLQMNYQMETPMMAAAAAGALEQLQRLLSHRRHCICRALDRNNFGQVETLSAHVLGLQPSAQEQPGPVTLALQHCHGAEALWLLQYLGDIDRCHHHAFTRLFLLQSLTSDWQAFNSTTVTLNLQYLLLSRCTEHIMAALCTANVDSSSFLLPEVAALTLALEPALGILDTLPHRSVVARVLFHPLLLHCLMVEVANATSCSSLAVVHDILQRLPWGCTAYVTLLEPLFAAVIRNYKIMWPVLERVLPKAAPVYLRSHACTLLHLIAKAAELGFPELKLVTWVLDLDDTETCVALVESCGLLAHILPTHRAAVAASSGVLAVTTELVGRYFPDCIEGCRICCEPLLTPTPVGIQFLNSQVQKRLCNHEFCLDCLKTWIVTELSAGRAEIRCPSAGCNFKFHPDDIERLAPDVAGRHRELCNIDSTAHLRELLGSGALANWVDKNARICPHCNVIIERSSGCDSMWCICGRKFMYSSAPVLSQMSAALA